LPSLEKATQLIAYLAALVGLVMTSPVSALYTTSISEMTTNKKFPSELYVQLYMTLEFGGYGFG
jgi:hypothetical protein